MPLPSSRRTEGYPRCLEQAVGGNLRPPSRRRARSHTPGQPGVWRSRNWLLTRWIVTTSSRNKTGSLRRLWRDVMVSEITIQSRKETLCFEARRLSWGAINEKYQTRKSSRIRDFLKGIRCLDTKGNSGPIECNTIVPVCRIVGTLVSYSSAFRGEQ